jgi:hypothetical protein
MKRKIEKKKRKEMQKNRESVTSSSSPSLLLGKSKSSSTTSSSHPTTPTLTTATSSSGSVSGTTADASSLSPLSTMQTLNDALVNFVLGDAMEQIGWLPQQDLDETPVGVSALHQMEVDEKNEKLTPPPPPALSLNAAKDQTDSITTISSLDFLLNAVPTPTYRGSFNPFAHQILRTSNTMFESPMRKTSRFGFAQI